MPFLRKYNTLTVTGTTAIRIPMIKRAVVDFAVGADWTPAAGDVKILIDGTAAANVANLPTAIAAGNTALWEFILTAAELSGKQIEVTIADSATKAVEDQSFIVETYGNASAMYAADLSLANLPANIAQINGAAVAVPATAGVLDVNTKNINNVAAATPGAAGGMLIAGANAGTTTFGALTCTGQFSISDGMAVTCTTANKSAIAASGNGTGHGIAGTSGNGATGQGIYGVSLATNGIGIRGDGKGAGAGMQGVGGLTGHGGQFSGGGTSGDGINATVTSGVPIRGDITGNITGNLSGSVGSVTGGVGGNVAGSVGSVTAGVIVTTNNDKTGYALSAAGVTAVWNEVVDGVYTARQLLRGFASALLSICSGMATATGVFRDISNTKNRITATQDANGNRSVVTLDLT